MRALLDNLRALVEAELAAKAGRKKAGGKKGAKARGLGGPGAWARGWAISWAPGLR